MLKKLEIFSVLLIIISLFLSCDDSSIVATKTPMPQDELKGYWLQVKNYYYEEYQPEEGPLNIETSDCDYDSILDRYCSAYFLQFTEDSAYEYWPSLDTVYTAMKKKYLLDGTTLKYYRTSTTLSDKICDLYKEDNCLVKEYYSYEKYSEKEEYSIRKIYKFVKYNGEFPPSSWSEKVDEDFLDELTFNDSIIITSDTVIPGSLNYEEQDYYYLKCDSSKNYLVYVKAFMFSMELLLFRDGASKKQVHKYEECDYNYGLNDQIANALIWECEKDEIIAIRINSNQPYVKGYYELYVEETELNSLNTNLE